MRKILLTTVALLAIGGTARAEYIAGFLPHTAANSESALNRVEADDSALAHECAVVGVPLAQCERDTLEAWGGLLNDAAIPYGRDPFGSATEEETLLAKACIAFHLKFSECTIENVELEIAKAAGDQEDRQ